MGAGFCEETEAGARVATHCLYPSFSPVSVFVTKVGDGYHVSDRGGAIRSSWLHGRETAQAGRLLAQEAERYHLQVRDMALEATAPSIDWLKAAILAVANASANAAMAAIGKIVAAAEGALKDRIKDELERSVPLERIGSDIVITGKHRSCSKRLT